MIEIIVSILLLIGGFLTLLSSIGILRLPDVYGRAHAAGKSSTLGVMSIMFATFIYFAGEGILNPEDPASDFIYFHHCTCFFLSD